ncbi:MAG: hypothetical protein M3R52_01715 [Acidobacteriota bacterium]|nr:hypothetical protein [Acidobacteriota bacterium]
MEITVVEDEVLMPRYWVMAPYHADKPELWDRVWKYNLEHDIISINNLFGFQVGKLGRHE